MKDMKIKLGDKVIVTDGSSDGHIGVVIAIHKTSIRIKREDGVEVDVSHYEKIS